MPRQVTVKTNGQDIYRLSENLAVATEKIDTIKIDVNDIKTKLEREYVTQDQFDPVKKIVYGLVSLILVAVVGALIALVVIK
jgi:hypothetical protein